MKVRERRKHLAADIAMFVKQYARKAPKHGEPNDRKYSWRVEQLVKRMNPEELDLFLREEDDFEETQEADR